MNPDTVYIYRIDKIQNDLTMKLKDFSVSEMPRERMLAFGPGALSNGELLAILLRTGTAKKNVLDLSREVLKKCNDSLVMLSRLDLRRLREFDGIKNDKAATIMAAFELGRRFVVETASLEEIVVDSAASAYRTLIPVMKGLGHEEVWVIFLNRALKLIDMQAVGIGSGSGVSVEAGEVVKVAIEKGAFALILAHNHPSGNPQPSRSDIQVTSDLRNCCRVCGIGFLDHVIVCDNSFYSFSEEIVTDVA